MVLDQKSYSEYSMCVRMIFLEFVDSFSVDLNYLK